MAESITYEDFEKSYKRFRDYSQTVSASSHVDFLTNLKIFINFVKKDEVLRPIIETIQKNTKIKGDIWYEKQSKTGGSFIGSARFELPSDEEERLSLLYQICELISEEKIQLNSFCMKFFTSNRLDDMVTDFNNTVFDKLFRLLKYKIEAVEEELRKLKRTEQVDERKFIKIIDKSTHIHGNVGGDVLTNNSKKSTPQEKVLGPYEEIKQIICKELKKHPLLWWAVGILTLVVTMMSVLQINPLSIIDWILPHNGVVLPEEPQPNGEPILPAFIPHGQPAEISIEEDLATYASTNHQLIHLITGNKEGTYRFELTLEPNNQVIKKGSDVGINDRKIMWSPEVTDAPKITQITFSLEKFPKLFTTSIETIKTESIGNKNYATIKLKLIFEEEAKEFRPHIYIPKTEVWDCQLDEVFRESSDNSYYIFEPEKTIAIENNKPQEILIACNIKNQNAKILDNGWWLEVKTDKLYGFEKYKVNYDGNYTLITESEISYFGNQEFSIG